MTLAERSPLTRDRITAAARDQVERVGVHELSLRAVARSLGVTGAALYRYVGSKQELVELVAADAFAELADSFSSVRADDPIGRLRGQAEVYTDFALANPELYRVMMRFPPALLAGAAAGESPDPAIEAFDPATDVFQAALDAVEEAIEVGVLAPVDPVIAALTLWSATHGLIEVLLMGLDLPDELAAAFTESSYDTVLRGLMP